MEAELVCRNEQSGETTRVSLPVPGRLIFGRDSTSGLVLDSKGMSRQHAALESDGASFWITDLSNNGTWLNGERLRNQGRQLVKPGDVIAAPGYQIEVRIGKGRSTEAQPAAVPAGNPVTRFLGSFTRLEWTMVLLAIVTFAIAYHELTF